MIDKTQLTDTASEGGIIGTLIIHPEFIEECSYLKPNYFSEPTNRCYFWAIQSLIQDEHINLIDAYNLSCKLQAHPSVKSTLEQYNFPGVQEAMDTYCIAARETIEEYLALVDNVVSLAYKRDLITTLGDIEKSCADKTVNMDRLSQSLYGNLDKLTERYIYKDNLHVLGEEIDDIWKEIEERRNIDGSYGIPSKYKVFDDYFTYEPGELVVVQANYKQGKSTFLLNETVHKLKSGIPTLVVDTEMRAPIYVTRLLSLLTGVFESKIRRGTYNAQEGELIQDGLNWIRNEAKLVYIYDPNMTMQQLYNTCKVLKNKIGLGFVVYDYMKSNERNTGDNYNALGMMCDFLKNRIAGELELPVLSAAQLNRSGYVADSIKINMYASVAIKWGLKLPEQQAKDGEKCGNAWAKVYVNRLGPSQQENDPDDYIDFYFSGGNMVVKEAQQHNQSVTKEEEDRIDNQDNINNGSGEQPF